MMYYSMAGLLEEYVYARLSFGRGSEMRSRLAAPARATGTVKWFHEGKSFGFISRDDGQPDCLVHRFDLRGESLTTLATGDRVAFDVVEGVRGPTAENVARLAPTIH